jgi:hypothetical protein
MPIMEEIYNANPIFEIIFGDSHHLPGSSARRHQNVTRVTTKTRHCAASEQSEMYIIQNNNNNTSVQD